MASRTFLVLIALAAAALGGCTTTQEQKDNNDPFEPVNRVVFKVNFAVNKYVGVPVATVYTTIFPKVIRHGVHNALNNMGEPVTFGNDVLQGETTRALQTLGRFSINTTIGVAGIFDVAGDWGMPPHDEDFGQTLAVYGVGEGPYLVLPLVGPAPPRDFGGHFVDVYFDPLYYVDFSGRHALLVGRHAAGLVDAQAQGVDAIKQLDASADPYAAARSAYRQHRNAEIRNGVPDGSHLPDITDVPPTSENPLAPIPRH